MDAKVMVKEEIISPSDICYESVFEQYDIGRIPARKLSTSSHDSTSGNSNCSSTASSDVSGYGSEILDSSNGLNNDKGRSFANSSLVEKNLEQHLSFGQQDKIKAILDAVQSLTDMEKLLLYLKLPTKENEQPILIANSKQEQTEAFQWIRNNLEECDASVNLPKHEVYDLYKLHCENKDSKRFLSAPDFGKIVKCLFPNVKARRLGTRGNSKYCYTGLRKREVNKSPTLPNIKTEKEISTNLDGIKNEASPIDDTIEQIFGAASIIVCEWANKLLGRYFTTLVDLARFLVSGSYVSTKSIAALTVMSASQENLEKINDRFSTLALKPTQVKKESNVNPKLNHEKVALALSERMSTPSRTVKGNKVKNSTENVQVVPTTPIRQIAPTTPVRQAVPTTSNRQIAPTTPVRQFVNISPKKTQVSSNNTSKANEIQFENFMIDVSSPIILDDVILEDTSHGSMTSSSDILLDNVNVVLNKEKSSVTTHNILLDNIQHTSPDVTSSPSKRQKKKPENLPMSSIFKVETTMNNVPASAPPIGQRTPRKVGRPRGRKNTPVSSPASAVPMYHSPQANRTQSPLYQFQGGMFPPQLNNQVNMQMNRFNGWSGNQHSPVPFNSNIQSPNDMELQAIFMRSQQKTPVNYNNFNLQRCQSVPVPQISNQVHHFQPLTPQQSHYNNTSIPYQNADVFKAKRNLSFMFNESNNINTFQKPNVLVNTTNTLQQNRISMPMDTMNQQNFIAGTNNERIVPTLNSSNMKQQSQMVNSSMLYNGSKPRDTLRPIKMLDMGVNMNDLATPDDLIDFPSSFDVNVDSDELLNNLEKSQHIWSNDWSTTSIPVMEFS